MKWEINKEEKGKIKKRVGVENNGEIEFPLPKYSSQIMNVINSTAQATRPKNVGQMSEIIPNFINLFYEENGRFPSHLEWKEFYLKNHKDKYEKGLSKLKEYVKKYYEAINEILNNEDMVKIWYDKFIFLQNFNGFRYEDIIFEWLKKDFILDKKRFSIRKSNEEEESKGIDFIIKNNKNEEELFFNSKPKSYSLEKKNINLNEKIIVVSYEEKDQKIEININDFDYKRMKEFLK